MSFVYCRTIRFQDTDAAGVVYFANLLSICHEAYEESLAATGIDLGQFFQGSAIAIPIVHTSADFFRPMLCGDRYLIQLVPQLLTNQKFEIHYAIALATATDQPVGKALTRHICIHPIQRTRQPLPAEILRWIEQYSQPGSPPPNS